MLFIALGMMACFVGGAVMDHFYGKNFLEEMRREVDDAKEIIDILVHGDYEDVEEEVEEEDEAK